VRPEAPTVNVEARVEPLTGSLPAIAWRWDPETDILSGAFKGNRKSGGLTGTVELTDDWRLGSYQAAAVAPTLFVFYVLRAAAYEL
jgi:hypothetical protein